MINRILSPTLPYIMDLETGISFPCAKAELASRDAIRCRAYLLWENEGRPDEHGLANWLDTESELQPDATARARDIPSAPVEASPGEGWPYSPADGKPIDAASRKTERSAPPEPRGHGDDIRDYAFHLYIQSGCAPAQRDESWREARLCLEARLPRKALSTVMPTRNSRSRRAVQ